MKAYRGKIVILKPKTNSGIVLLENGIKTDMINFAKTLEDGDQVAVEFIDDNPNGEIHRVKYCGEEYYYGYIISGNTVVCNYPKMYGSINFAKLSDADFSKLSKPDNKNPEFMTIFGVQVKFKINKTDSAISAYGLENIDYKERHKCSSPLFGYIKNTKFEYFNSFNKPSPKLTYSGKVFNIVKNETNWFGFIRSSVGDVYFNSYAIKNIPKKGDEVTFEYKETVIKEQKKLTATKVQLDTADKNISLLNIPADQILPYSDSGSALYYAYSADKVNANEIFPFDNGNTNQLVNCYKTAPDNIKVTIIDSLIEANLTIKHLSPNELKPEKIRILRELAKSDKKWLIELQKIKYKPEELNTAGNSDQSILEMQAVDISEKHYTSRRPWAVEMDNL